MLDPASRERQGEAVLTAWHLPMEALRPRAPPPRRDREAENKAITRAMLRLDEASIEDEASRAAGSGQGEGKEAEAEDESSSSSSDGEDGDGGGGTDDDDFADDPVGAARARIESKYKRAPAGLWIPALPLVPSVVVTNRGCGRPALREDEVTGPFGVDAASQVTDEGSAAMLQD